MRGSQQSERGGGKTVLFVPGRLCLFGEHSDWAGARRAEDPNVAPGACLVVGTDQGIHATAVASDHFELTTCLPDGSRRGPVRVSLDESAFAAAIAGGDFFSYAAGAAAEVWRRFQCGGVRIDVDAMDLPLARGLSSSAAICVLTVRAFNVTYDLGLGLRDEMELAYRGEIAAGSQCGRMDQACAYGKRPVLLRFDGPRFDVEPISVGGTFHLLMVDLMHRKDTRRILADLQRELLIGAEGLRETLGVRNLAIVAAARTALEEGDAEALGVLMSRAQVMFDRDVAPCSYAELRAPRLHAVLRFGPAASLSWGGKGVGSQGDGCAQFVCRGEEQRLELARQIEAAGLGRCLPLTISAL